MRYDALIIALGATPNVAMAPGATEHALTFKGAGDAVTIRNRVIDLFEAGALTDDPWVRQRLLTFVVVGAGHAGTELMAALEELARGILLRHYPSIPKDSVRLVFRHTGRVKNRGARSSASALITDLAQKGADWEIPAPSALGTE